MKYIDSHCHLYKFNEIEIKRILKNKDIIKDITQKEVIPTIFVGKPVQKEAIYKKRNIVHKIRQHLVRYPYLYSIAARSYKRFFKA